MKNCSIKLFLVKFNTKSLYLRTSFITIEFNWTLVSNEPYFFFLNWRLITILWWFLPYIHINQPWVYMCSPSWPSLPPPSPFYPSGSSQCTNPEHPVSCVERGLAIYFTCDNICVSVLFSQIIPPRLFPQSPKVCSLCLFCCSHIGSSLPSF